MRNSDILRIVLFITGIAVFSVGISYYLWERLVIPATIQYLGEWFPLGAVPDVAPAISSTTALNWLPTFVHVVSFSLLSISASRISNRRSYLVIGFWVGINILFELGQLFGLPGTFDAADICAAIVGGVCIAVLVRLLLVCNSGSKCVITHETRTAKQGRFNSGSVSVATVLIAGLGIVSISGSYTYCEDSEGNGCEVIYDAEPVYMSYEELRTSAIRVQPNEPLTKTGKIYLYQNYLLVNSPNEGVHVYDNSDKQNPTHLAFINIPGNIDIAVKQDYLYVDSYVDLVVLDISDMSNIREVHRVTDIFPYNPYQNVPVEIWIGPLDPSKGVVIGYKENF